MKRTLLCGLFAVMFAAGAGVAGAQYSIPRGQPYGPRPGTVLPRQAQPYDSPAGPAAASPGATPLGSPEPAPADVVTPLGDAAAPIYQPSMGRGCAACDDESDFLGFGRGWGGRRGGCDPCGDGCGAACDECPRLNVQWNAGIDSFRGVSDLWTDNFGIVTGLNAGMPLPVLHRLGIGGQIGISYGLYDWSGRTFDARHPAAAQEQTFVTTGLFHRATGGERLSYGFGYDWMINNHWGSAGTSPTLGQWRYQADFAVNACNSVGVYGTIHDKQYNGSLRARAIEYVNLFWQHKFECGPDGRLWIGIPEHERLGEHGGLAEFILGAGITAPLNDRWALYGNAQYVVPSARSGPVAAVENGYNISVGLVFYPGRNSRTSTVAGSCWGPYLPLANNSNFLVDQGTGLNETRN